MHYSITIRSPRWTSGIAGITRNTIWESLRAWQQCSKNQVLANLNLAHCGLQRSRPIIRSCTASCTHKLNLSGNKIKDEGCRAIAYLLSNGSARCVADFDETKLLALVLTIGDALRTTGVQASTACLSLNFFR